MAVAAILLVGAAGCGLPSTAAAGGTGGGTTAGGADGAGIGTTAEPPTTAGISVLPGTGQCQARQEDGYVLPDPACTPGATNPEVTQADIGQTICKSGWTSTVRPPESYTEPLKRSQLAEYGETGSLSGYEEDHLIPLEVGGATSDPHNLWPEPGASPNPKDDVERAANRAVCDGRMSLAAAQQGIATDWVALGRQLGAL